MAFRFIHTADWQIGKVFRFLEVAEMGGLQLARLEAITRIGELAEEHDTYATYWLRATSTTTQLPRPARATRSSSECGLTRPCSGTCCRETTIRTSPTGSGTSSERRGLPDNVHAHTESVGAVIEPDVAVLLPAPLHHRRTLSDPTAWMDDHPSDDGLIRIGLAHGAVHGFDTDEEQRANPIDPERPQLARLDYLALGDWHGERTGQRALLVQRHARDGLFSDPRQGH